MTKAVTPTPPLSNFSCHEAANGGWIVTQHTIERGLMPVHIGAFTTPADLITFLHGQLVAQPADECRPLVEIIANTRKAALEEAAVIAETSGENALKFAESQLGGRDRDFDRFSDGCVSTARRIREAAE